MGYEININLDLIARFINFHMRRNGGVFPDWLRPMDLIALHNLADAWSYQREYQADYDTFRREMSLGGEDITKVVSGV